MPSVLGIHERAERHDLAPLRAGICDEMLDQRGACPGAAHGLGDAGVIAAAQHIVPVSPEQEVGIRTTAEGIATGATTAANPIPCTTLTQHDAAIAVLRQELTAGDRLHVAQLTN